VVVELLAPVISWHQNRLVPAASVLMDDPRCSILEGDSFEIVSPGKGEGRYDAVLLDIDHSPESWLDERHGGFYTVAGLRGLAECLRPGGVFGLWSASEPTDRFLGPLKSVMRSVRVEEISFPNPHLGLTDSNWIVLAGA
jgi:spermidine synthase